jgi:hypothetical protein
MDHNDDIYDELRGKVEYPEPWKPQNGSPQTLIGEVIAEAEIPFTDMKTGEEKHVDAFVVRDQDRKEWSIAAFHAALRRELWENEERGKTQIGDFVALHYRGEGVTQEGRPVHR